MSARPSKLPKKSAGMGRGGSSIPTASLPSESPDSKEGSLGAVGDDGYLPMIWTNEAGIRKTWDMLLYIKDNHYLRRSLYPRPGEDSTAMKHTEVHQQLADLLLKGDPIFAEIYAKLKGKYGRAIKARLHKLYEVYCNKRALLANSGAGLSDADRFRYPEVKNLQELVRIQFPWYDLMDEFVHERAALGQDSLVNSDDQADLTVVGWGRVGSLSAARGADMDTEDLVQNRASHPASSQDPDGGGGDGQAEAPLADKEDGDGSKDSPVTIRHTRVAPIDMAPIESAIRDGDVLRERSKKERLDMLTSVREVEKTKKLEARERRAAAEWEFKLKREEMRLKFATDKLNLQIQQSEAETKLVQARIQEGLMLMRSNGIGTSGTKGGDEEEVDPSVKSGGSCGPQNHKRIWEDV